MTLPSLQVPSLRPQLLGAPFPGTELPDLATALEQVQSWIDSGEERIHDRSSRWTAWPDQPQFRPTYGPVSLNTGAAGIAWYSLSQAEATGETTHLERASRAATFISVAWHEHLDDLALNIPGVGLAYYGGLAGIAAVLVQLADRLPQHRATAIELLEHIVARTGASGGRPFGWTGTNALMGDGGIVITLIDAAERLEEPRFLAAAVEAGLGILADERIAEHGSSWPGVDPSLLGLPAGTKLDGFELGTVGIAFVLAKLALATGDRRFVEAAERASENIAARAVVVGDAAVFARAGGEYSFGYCTGSAGVIRAFLGVYRATGDSDHLEWALRFGRGILRSGVPGRQTPGNAYVFHQCCGSAAVLESFIGLWLETGDRLWLDAAQAQGDDLLIRSTTDDAGRRWYSEAHVLPTGTLKAEVGHQVGASGIALSLLHLQQALEAAMGTRPFRALRLPDDPFRTECSDEPRH